MGTPAELLKLDPVTNHGAGQELYILPYVSDEEAFYTRKLPYIFSPAEAREEVDTLRALSYFDVDIVPFELREEAGEFGSEVRARAIQVKGTTAPNLSRSQVANDCEDLALGLTGYFHDRYSKHEPFRADLAKRVQFVYGTYEGKDKPGFVLVDLDPMLMRSNSDDHASENEAYRSNYIRELSHIFSRFVKPLERAQGHTYDACRQLLREAIELVPVDNGITAEAVGQLMKDIEQVDYPERPTGLRRLGRFVMARSADRLSSWST